MSGIEIASLYRCVDHVVIRRLHKNRRVRLFKYSIVGIRFESFQHWIRRLPARTLKGSMSRALQCHALYLIRAIIGSASAARLLVCLCTIEAQMGRHN